MGPIREDNWKGIKNVEVMAWNNTIIPLRNLNQLKHKSNKSSKQLANDCYTAYLRSNLNSFKTINANIGQQIFNEITRRYRSSIKSNNALSPSTPQLIINIKPKAQRLQKTKPNKSPPPQKIICGFKTLNH